MIPEIDDKMPSDSRQMIRSLSVLASVPTVMLCSLIEVVAADDDPLLQLKVFGDPTAGVQYVWALRRSEIEAAPSWDPLNGEAPLSPHQAVVGGPKVPSGALWAILASYLADLDVAFKARRLEQRCRALSRKFHARPVGL